MDSPSKVFTLYGLKRPDESEIRYVGITGRSLRRRLKLHICQKGINTHKDRWIEKMLPLVPEIIPFATAATWGEIQQMERDVIGSLRQQGFRLINLTEGGDGLSGKRSPEFCQRMSATRTGAGNPMFGKIPWNKGKRQSPEQNKNHRGMTGRKHSADTKQKMSIIRTGKKHTEESRLNMSQAAVARGTGPSFRGRKHTEESKQKISLAKTGQPAKNRGESNGMFGHKYSEEEKTKMRKAQQLRRERERQEKMLAEMWR